MELYRNEADSGSFVLLCFSVHLSGTSPIFSPESSPCNCAVCPISVIGFRNFASPSGIYVSASGDRWRVCIRSLYELLR